MRTRLRHNFNLDKARTTKAKRIVRATVATATYCNRVRSVCAYIRWHAENVIQRIPSGQPDRTREAETGLDDFEKMMLAHLPTPKTGGREAMDEQQRATFLAAAVPGSPTNPFKPPYQHRNYAIMLVLDETGCRRGEGLKLTGNDLHLTGEKPFITIAVRENEINDPRRNEPRAKTLGRDRDISKETAAILRDYVVNHRSKLPHAKKSPFIFLSRAGQPLSAQAVNDMFRLLRLRSPGLPDDVTPHVMRHTWNERYSDACDELGMSEAEEAQSRNYAMGWKKNSNQSAAYLQRRTKKKAQDASLRMQEKSWGKTDK
jgi:integrase